MPAIRGITVAVGEWYARTLEICLVRNMRHLTSCLVVTAPGDPSIQVARAVPGVGVFETSAFFEHGAKFNKSYALELAFDVLGREGWILIHDADILLAESLPLDRLRPDALHGATRRILNDPAAWRPGLDWNVAPTSRDGSPIGFFQLFRADAASLEGKRPWYDVSFAHAGGGDAAFMMHWPREKQTILPTEVLHLGPRDRHWWGCEQEAQDIMARFVTENGWSRAAAQFSPEQVARAGAYSERVEVPGYPKSDYQLPFVRRAQEARQRQGQG